MYIEVVNYFKSYSFAWLGIACLVKNDFKINMRKNRFDESDIQRAMLTCKCMHFCIINERGKSEKKYLTH